MIYQRLFKGLLDRIIAFALLILLSPVIVLVSGLIWVSTGANPFFVQRRPGYKERIFSLYKLKTMSDSKDSDGNLLPDNERLSRIGQWARKYSLDELPQLVNILKGEMSLVGPRPLLIQYLQLYNDEQRKRHQVKPGITGLAQVNGRNALSWKEKFAFDVFYSEHVSLTLDLQILFKTVATVVTKQGVNAKSDVTSEIFKGNSED
jgi:lipopolysaccharide/colanic/teichoic acid biosynthesis glycosyltransferase